MQNFIFIPYVNRPDLLEKAISTAYKVSSDAIVVDNSKEGLPKLDTWIQVIRPTVPLLFAQVQNWARQYAIDNKCTHYYFIHSDCEADEKTVNGLKASVEQNIENNTRWGVIFTYYDTLCAFNVDCVKAVGEWDTDIPWYFCDCDYYRRIELAGFKKIDTDLTTNHYSGGSSTLKNDPILRYKQKYIHRLSEQLYIEKWGGQPSKERYLSPYNRPDIYDKII